MHIHRLGINLIGPLPQQVARQAFPVRLPGRLPDNQRVWPGLGLGWRRKQQAFIFATPAKAASTSSAAIHARHPRCPHPALPTLAALGRERRLAAGFADLLCPGFAASYIALVLLGFPLLAILFFVHHLDFL